MSGTLQANNRFVVPKEAVVSDWYAGLVAHRKEETLRMFGEELIKALAKSGGIVGPIHETYAETEDWLLGTDMLDCKHTVYAYVTDLPEPEQYRMVGGPADGLIARTEGLRIWRVPFLRPSYGNPFEAPEIVRPEYAEYEREGNTQVYLFKGIS